mmetsp:Transcript_125146/g.400037  ORF Transcript_125146/g.400037 Transcript_125146/m.400037 type:complete len:348 (-) Transcript_125146:106-1149(-)
MGLVTMLSGVFLGQLVMAAPVAKLVGCCMSSTSATPWSSRASSRMRSSSSWGASRAWASRAISASARRASRAIASRAPVAQRARASRVCAPPWEPGIFSEGTSRSWQVARAPGHSWAGAGQSRRNKGDKEECEGFNDTKLDINFEGGDFDVEVKKANFEKAVYIEKAALQKETAVQAVIEKAVYIEKVGMQKATVGMRCNAAHKVKAEEAFNESEMAIEKADIEKDVYIEKADLYKETAGKADFEKAAIQKVTAGMLGNAADKVKAASLKEQKVNTTEAKHIDKVAVQTGMFGQAAGKVKAASLKEQKVNTKEANIEKAKEQAKLKAVVVKAVKAKHEESWKDTGWW